MPVEALAPKKKDTSRKKEKILESTFSNKSSIKGLQFFPRHVESIPSSFLSYFASKANLNYCPSNNKINFRVSHFEKDTSAETSDLGSVNSTYHEDYFHGCEYKDINLNIKFENFVLTKSEDNPFEDDISTSYFLKKTRHNFL